MPTQSSLKSKTTKGIIWSIIEKFSVNAGQFIIGVILARLLMPADFGLIGMLSIFLVFSQSLIDSGMGSGLVQKKDRQDVDFSTVFVFNFLISLLIYLILYFSAPYIADFYNMPKLIPLTRVLTIIIVINSLAIVQRSNLTINVDFKTNAKVNLISVIIGGIVGIAFAMQDFGVWALVAQTLTSSVVSVIMLWYVSRWEFSLRFSTESFKSLFTYGYKLTLSGLYSKSMDEIYNLSIGKAYSASDLGFYTRAKNFAGIIASTVTSVLDQVTFPVLASLQDEKERLASVFSRLIKMTAFLIVPSMTLFALLADPFIRVVLTDKWVNVVPLLQLMCFARIFYPMSIINLNILKAVGRSDLFLKVNLAKLPILVITLLITIPMGVNSIVVGHVITSTLGYLMNTYLPGKMYGYGAFKQIKDMFPLFIAAAVMSLVVYAVMYFIHSDILRLIIGFISGIATYFAVCYLLKLDEIDEIISLIKKNIPKKA